MRRAALIGTILVLWSSTASAQAPEEGFIVPFEGELIDDSNTPLAGLFALDFKLYDGEEANAAVWHERHFVSVVNGEYSVGLGRSVSLDPALRNQERWVAVEFMGGELLRTEKLLVQDDSEDEINPLVDYLRGEPISQVTFSAFSENALVAQEALHADDCMAIGGKTLQELDRFSEFEALLANHEANPDAHGGGLRLSDRTQLLQRVGGDGGTPYTRMCPPGQVVVGVRGGAALMVDSIVLVCAELE